MLKGFIARRGRALGKSSQASRRASPISFSIEGLERRTMMSSVTTNGVLLQGVEGAGTGISTANAAGATGPTSTVFMTDAGVTIDSTSTGSQLASMSLQQFWANAGITQSAPKQSQIIYDPVTSRWYASGNDYAGTSSSTILVAVSASSDPTGAWKAAPILVSTFTQNTNDAVRFPAMGIDANGLYLSADNYSISQPALNQRVIFAIPKGDLQWSGAGSPSLVNMKYFPFGAPSQNQFIGTIRPTVNYKANRPLSAQYLFVDRYNGTVGGLPTTGIEINYLQWSKDLQGNLSAAIYQSIPIGVPLFQVIGMPTPVAQPGANSQLINAGDGRILSAATIGGYLYTLIPGTINQFGARVGAVWLQAPVTAPYSLTDEGYLFNNNADIIYPTIAANGVGNIAISYTEVSTSEYASEYLTGHTNSDAFGTLDTPVETLAGGSVYSDGTNNAVASYGFNTTTVLDPNNANGFWGFQAAADTVASADNWVVDTLEVMIS